MKNLLDPLKNLFKFEDHNIVDKEITYARLIEINGETYFSTQFKLDAVDENSVPPSELENYRKPIATDNSIFKKNSYTTGDVRISEIDGTTSELKMTFQIATKVPPWGEGDN